MMKIGLGYLFLVIIDTMSLTKEEIEHIAELARLELTEEEKLLYREQLSAILDYAARLQTLDTSHISHRHLLYWRSAVPCAR
jgi:hypothetical protein